MANKNLSAAKSAKNDEFYTSGFVETIKRWLANFVFVNLIVIALWWVMTEGSPALLYVTVDSPNGATVESVGGRKIDFAGGGIKSYRIILPADFREDIIPLKIEPMDEMVRLLGARIVSRFVFELGWTLNRPASEITCLNRGDAVFRVPPKVIVPVLALELLLAVLSFVLMAVARRSRMPSYVELLGVAIAVSTLLVLIAPVQTIVANGSELGTSLAETLGALILPFTLMLLALSGLLLLTRRSGGVIFPAFLLGVAVYTYLELGILSADFPTLDGEIYFFLNPVRGICDVGVFLLICILLVVVAWRWATILSIISAAVVVLSLASVFDAHKALQTRPRSELGLTFKPNGEILSDCYHSTNRNVSVYILDSVAIPFATEVLRRDPVLVDDLEGFVAYTNNVGMAGSTVMGVAGLVTGTYLQNPLHFTEYTQSCFGSNSFVRAYSERGAAVFYAPGSFKYGLSSVPRTNQKASMIKTNPLRRRMRDQQQWNLFELSRFRLVPFIAKVYVYRMSISGWDVSRTEYDERWCFPGIASAPIRSGCPLTLQLWHTHGAHPPFDINRDGVMDGAVRDDDQAILEKTWYSMRRFAALMKMLKERKLYDQTFIVLAADHGIESRNSSNGETPEIPGRARPILFVKPFDAHGPMVYSPVPTSHAKIKPLLERVAVQNLNRDACTAALETPVRIYSCENGGIVTGYRIDGKGALIEKGVQASVSLDSILPILLDHSYSLFANNVADPPPLVFDGTGFFGAADPRVIHGSSSQKTLYARISFRTPVSQTHYRLHLQIRTSGTEYSQGPDGYSFLMEDRRVGTKGGLRERTPALRDVVLPVMSDEKGVVVVDITCFDTTELRSLRVSL